MRRINGTMALLAVAALAVASMGLACGSSGSSSAGDTSMPATTSMPESEKNVVETAAAAGQFETLASLLTKAGLAGTLQGEGPFTVFAPTDAAFAKVPKKTLDGLAADPAQLKSVLLYHVVPGRVTAADAAKLDSAKTLEGGSVAIKVDDGALYVDGAEVTTADVPASNGVIHVVDQVLIP